MISKPGTHLPEEPKQQLRKAARTEWVSIGYTAFTVALVALVVGNSQAMRTAWVEDMLSVLPQIAFLIALRFTRGPRRPTHPYGYHRSVGAGHVLAGVALVAVGALLAYEAVFALVTAEHPTIGSVNLFGHTIWQGWLMVAVMTAIGAPAVVLGHLKIKAAKPLHNKLLYADSKMAKADWQTNAASVVGVAGIGIGLSWLDSAAALIISFGIPKEGWDSARSATSDLLDRRSSGGDGTDPHPLITRLEKHLAAQPWVKASAIRARELGQVRHLEIFVIPDAEEVSIAQMNAVCGELSEVGWKAYDVVVIPVAALPDHLEISTSR